MSEKKPPPWDDDPLSMFFSDAEFNQRVTALQFAPVFNLLRNTNEVFRQFEGAIEKDNREELLVPRFLMVRSHSAFLAALRLGMSGQVSECFAVLRSGIEQAWYAMHIAKDPNPPVRATIWLNRNESPVEKSRCKSEFTVAKVKATHEGLDPKTAQAFHATYENLIDFGAHPNQFGVMTALTMLETANQVH